MLYEEIGEGKFGKVFRCVEKATKLELAAKSIRLKKVEKSFQRYFVIYQLFWLKLSAIKIEVDNSDKLEILSI